MMKTKMLIGALIMALAAGFGLAGLAYAQTPNPPAPETPAGPGMMNPGRMGRGMFGMRSSRGFGPMHEYMEEALAKAMGVTEEELEAAFSEGKTMWQLAEEKGMSAEEFKKVMVEARKTAIAEMVTAGIITQAQADWMLNRMENRSEQGGFRRCPGMGGFGRGGGRWNNPGVPPATNPTSYGL